MRLGLVAGCQVPHWEVVTRCEVLVSAIEIYNEAVQDTCERALHFNYGGIVKAR